MKRMLSRRKFWWTVRVGAPLAMVAVLAAACGSSGNSNSAGSSSGSNTGTTSGSGMVETHSGPNGTFLTDSSGKTLYLFQSDTASASSCTGACAAAWPPVTSSGQPTASGDAKSNMLGTIKRSDGTSQVTYNGHPLYTYVGDSAPGQTNGEGSSQFGALWYVVSPAGMAITSGGPSGSSGSSSGGAWG